MKNQKIKQSGQTLVILLVYMVIAIIVTTAAVSIMISNSRGTDSVLQGTTALDIAESGAETAMIKLLRNNLYTGETITVNGGTAVVTVDTASKTVLSKGTLNNFTRIIQVVYDISNNVLTVVSWKEI